MSDHARTIQRLHREAAEAKAQATHLIYIKIGRELLATRGELPEGEFNAWVQRNFNKGPKWALRMMNAARADSGG